MALLDMQGMELKTAAAGTAAVAGTAAGAVNSASCCATAWPASRSACSTRSHASLGTARSAASSGRAPRRLPEGIRAEPRPTPWPFRRAPGAPGR